MKTLVHRGADINFQDEDGNTSLHYAYSTTREGAKAMQEYLVKKGGDLELQNSGGMVPTEGISRSDD